MPIDPQWSLIDVLFGPTIGSLFIKNKVPDLSESTICRSDATIYWSCFWKAFFVSNDCGFEMTLPYFSNAALHPNVLRSKDP